jgi:hypothetical protein
MLVCGLWVEGVPFWDGGVYPRLVFERVRKSLGINKFRECSFFGVCNALIGLALRARLASMDIRF